MIIFEETLFCHNIIPTSVSIIPSSEFLIGSQQWNYSFAIHFTQNKENHFISASSSQKNANFFNHFRSISQACYKKVSPLAQILSFTQKLFSLATIWRFSSMRPANLRQRNEKLILRHRHRESKFNRVFHFPPAGEETFCVKLQIFGASHVTFPHPAARWMIQINFLNKSIKFRNLKAILAGCPLLVLFLPPG